MWRVESRSVAFSWFLTFQNMSCHFGASAGAADLDVASGATACCPTVAGGGNGEKAPSPPNADIIDGLPPD